MTLDEFIKKKEWNYQFMATLLDYTRSHICRVAKGKSKPSAKLRKRISELTNDEVKW